MIVFRCRSLIPFQTFSQFFPCDENPAFDGSDFQPQNIGYLSVFVPLMEHFKRNSVFILQSVYCRIDFLLTEVRLRIDVNHIFVLPKMKQILGGIEDGIVPRLFSVMIDERVFHNGKCPRPQIGGIFKLVAVLQRSQKSILQQIIGVIPVGC